MHWKSDLNETFCLLFSDKSINFVLNVILSSENKQANKNLCQLLSKGHTKQQVRLGGVYSPYFSEHDDTATAVISSRAVST